MLYWKLGKHMEKPTKTIASRISVETYEKVKRKANEEGVTPAELLRIYVEAAVSDPQEEVQRIVDFKIGMQQIADTAMRELKDHKVWIDELDKKIAGLQEEQAG